MEEMNNNINPNQQPQPQQEEEEKKKKNKLVAWWLGLGKWAKVGICAGTAAVLATGITLAIVLPNLNKNNGGDGGTRECLWAKNYEYKSEKFNVKKDYVYKFTCTINQSETQVFSLNKTDEMGYVPFKNAKLEGAPGNNWEYDSSSHRFGGDPIESGTVTITLTALEDASNVEGCFKLEGQ